MEYGIGNPWTGAPGHRHCADPSFGCYINYPVDITPFEVDTIAVTAPFNLVRLPIAWSNLEPTAYNGSHTWNDTYLIAVAAVIDALQAANPLTVVMLSFHQLGWSPIFTPGAGKNLLGFPAWLYPNFPAITPSNLIHYRTIAQQMFMDNVTFAGRAQQDLYADAIAHVASFFNNYTGFLGIDVFNEPPPVPNRALSLWTPVYQTIHDAIRAVNSTAILSYALIQYHGGYLAEPTFPIDALSWLTWHLYSGDYGGSFAAAMGAFYPRMQLAQQTRPFWIGEFNYSGQPSNGQCPPNNADTATFLQVLKGNGVHWTYWAYDRAAKALATGSSSYDVNLMALLQGGF